MGWTTAIVAATSVAAAKQASAAGKYNQAIQNRNAEVAEQEAKAIQQRTELDLARFDQQFQQLQSETKVSVLKSGAELSGTALKILRSNAEQAEVEKNIMEYNSKIGQARAFEQANFARMQGNLARQQGRAAAIGYYGQAASALAPYGKSLLGKETQTITDLTATEGSF
nr:internal virion protein B-like protein [uncultured Mediterranean phage uvMED]BAR15178.1 internal virion protein B-like protein [uncultured Mediterranean phage uvMED]BAR15197.1 internal virion protein B-like protein [uncultured Mediterranean phage uvMED]BAR15212.1 internal virion protein B-like protein [uncultured Mediterranean phage uvMED]BAR15233.1 internal virion protein B-like protein [uncultured Mediterranean phage uvMED]